MKCGAFLIISVRNRGESVNAYFISPVVSVIPLRRIVAFYDVAFGPGSFSMTPHNSIMSISIR